MAYSQSLWQEIYRNGTDLQVTDNGLVEAIYTIISTLGVYLVGIITIPSWWLVGILTFSQGLVLLIMAQENLLSHAYVGYIMFGTFYHIMATAANCEVAKNIPADSYALVFGVNTFMSLLLQTCLTIVVNSPVGLMLDIRTQTNNDRVVENFKGNRPLRGTKRQSSLKKQNRLLSLFTIVKFDNEPCYSSSGDSGICMTSTECYQHRGVPIGSCANSYGVCCLSLSTCGQTIRENGTYFVNAGYPDGLNNTGTCQVTIHKLSPHICQFRLDFERFSIMGPEPVNHQCDNDQFIVSGSNPVPVICGLNTGSHMYVDAGTGTSPIILTMVTSGIFLKRNWKIKISQIPCDSITKADTGCLQYYTGVSGTLKSFNYESYSGLHLSNQDYTICLRTERNFCSVQYSACDDQMNNRSHAFTLTGNTLGQNPVQANVGSVGSSPCSSDYLIIPCVSSKQGPVASGMNTCVDRLCGGTLNTDYSTIPTTVMSSVRPFRLSFHTNAVEMPNDMGNRGFCLNYIQQPCNANYA